MKTTFSITTDRLGVDQNAVNNFLTNEEKDFLIKFFQDYAEKNYPEKIKWHYKECQEKISALKAKGFSPDVKEIMKFSPKDHHGHISLQIFYHITWPNNHHDTSYPGDGRLIGEYYFDRAFLHADLTAIEMAEGEKAQKIINRAIDYARCEKRSREAVKKLEELTENKD